MEVPVNYLAVLAVGVWSIVLGSLWYGPLFGKKWIVLMGFTQEQINQGKSKGMGKTYFLSFIGSLILGYVLAHLVVFSESYFNRTGASVGLLSGFWNWLGFIAPVTLSSVLWEGKSWQLWFLNNGYYLVFLSVAGIIIAIW